MNTSDLFNKDERPQRHGWAPGGYTCKCYTCGATFVGDKRAVTCVDCAYKDAPAMSTSETPTPRTERAIEVATLGGDLARDPCAAFNILSESMRQLERELSAAKADSDVLREAVKAALRHFEAMPEATPHATKHGIWAQWTAGCNTLRAAIDAARNLDNPR